MTYNHRDKGIVLRSYDYGEGHRVVVVFTEHSGKLRAAAKGSRKTKSRFGAKLEPFSENEFLFYRKPTGMLYTITGCYPLKSNEKLREDMCRYVYSAVMAEAVDLMNADEDPDRKVYLLFAEALKDVREKEPASSAWLFLFRLLKYSGYRLNMFSCISCGKKAGEGMFFIPDEGGIGCRSCFRGEKNVVSLSPEALEEIKKLSPERKLNLHIQREIGNIIAKFVKYQFNRDFKSFGFLNLFRDKKENKCIFSN